VPTHRAGGARVAIVKELLAAGVSPTQKEGNEHGWGVPHLAAYHGRPIILATLVEAAGPDAAALANDATSCSWMPLHFAIRRGKSTVVDCVRVLLRAGADVHLRNGMHHTALDCAIASSRRRVYPMLLAAGATIFPNTHVPADTAYLRKVVAAGGFPAYEKAHRARLSVTCARVVFPRLPIEVVSQIVAFAFHTGYY